MWTESRRARLSRLSGCISLVAIAGAITFAVVPLRAAAASRKVTVAVLGFDDRGAGADTTANMAALVSSELSRITILQVISSRDIAHLLSVEQQRQLLGCADTSCMTDLAGTLGAEYLVAGNVGKVGAEYLIDLQLLHQGSATVEAREEVRTGGAIEGLISAIQSAARRLIRPVLKAREGSLLLTVSVEGASVYVDDKLVGVTPLRRLVVTWGPHAVRVERTGFVAYARDIDVDSDVVVALEVVLVPSAEYVRDFQRRNGLMQGFAWAGVGVAALGAAGAIAWGVDGQQALTSFNTKLNSLESSGAAVATSGGYQYRTQQARTQSEPGLQTLRDRGTTDTTLTRVSVAVGAAGAVTATVLFILGDDPRRFERLQAEHASIEPVLLGNGLALAGTF
jgi:hypothetical protein